jgi:hypothetical protein
MRLHTPDKIPCMVSVKLDSIHREVIGKTG